jgi:hypothetical protein
MPTNSLFEGAISALQKSLNMGSLRHKVLTANTSKVLKYGFTAAQSADSQYRQYRYAELQSI